MSWLKIARMIVCTAAILFAAKPFVGFCLPHHMKSPVETNIVVKIFSKRKVEDGRNAMNAIQQILSAPADNLIPRIAFLLSVLFPAAFLFFSESENRQLRRLRLSLQPQALTVANRQFRI